MDAKSTKYASGFAKVTPNPSSSSYGGGFEEAGFFYVDFINEL